MVGVVLVIGAAFGYPPLGKKHGPLHPEITVKYLAVFFIFLNSGLALRVDELSQALKRFKLLFGILATNMVVVPFFATMAVKAIRPLALVEDAVLQGFVVVSCMPPPVSSAVVLTRACAANDAIAVCASAIGSFAGLVVTPLTLMTITGIKANAPILSIMMKLGGTVLLPIIIGQAIRGKYEAIVLKLRLPHSLISNVLLLLIIYSTFCDTFSESVPITGSSLAFTAVLVVVFQSFLLFLYFKVGSTLLTTKGEGIEGRGDVVAVMYCSSHKSLTLGIPLLKIMYEGNPILSVISIPLLIYHPVQILLGSTLVQSLKRWSSTTGYEKIASDDDDLEDRGPSPS